MSPPSIFNLTWTELRQIFHGFFPGNPTFLEKDYPSLDNKVVIVTGGNAGVGYQVVKSLAGSTNAKIYIFSRNEEKTKHAIEQMKLEIAQEYSKSINSINFIKVDFADLTTIRPAVDKFLQQEERLDLIIHNAGVMTPPRHSKTKQGYQLELGTNVIGPHLLQTLLDPILISTSKLNKPNESRIVWIGSTSHFFAPYGGLNWKDPNYENSPNVPLKEMYSQSKALVMMQAIQWPKRHPEASNVVSVSVCPGYLRTELQRNMPFFSRIGYDLTFHKARYGAYTELFAALSPEVTKQRNGEHIISFGNWGVIRDDIKDAANCEKVWDYLQEQIKPYLV
ncbi:RDH2 [[Candida] subhashii]|uniref:RDH2 n=1 Tax=[Candida] subhashii TaxID=561895 RepID=A0A8J5QEE4_9ASCO|nr:RDH2 [[Candida] subhashii]KAG7664439.1 RDH2 [[Candida] subhashii]